MLYTVREAAQMLGISKSSVYILVNTGKLNSYRIGLKYGAIRIQQEDLDKADEALIHNSAA